ncbi:MAG: heterodisulfide reductase subunit C [Rhodospirillaceae bacterium]|nr:heterodisulfide reductase subunit C [Rhodospirillaceae bacterium]MBT5513758.1 heterodisulfide reductase subunit C [Rhodospirillaceae bacterium]MBT6085081.1 heterodisulfide reductase subunit C [Rhodospirillaceae bacterium]
MPIHEKQLIRPENLVTHDELVIDGVDVSGHWSTFIESRVVTDYNEDMETEIAALPGGEHIHRCWQCGSCTNACTVNALNERFNPRFWIYLIRTGMEEELLRDKDIIWQCVSCNKCTYACPRDVNPEGVMKATSHWLELKGHTEKSPSMHFDEEFAAQVFKTGKIEEGRIIRGFFKRTNQALMQDWLVEMVKRLVRHLPVKLLFMMGMANLARPKTRGWGGAEAAVNEYVAEREASNRKALGLDKEPTT